jgi:hypothetical protein
MANSIIQMSGGLGNQLFQFAMKRSIEYSTGSTTKLDIAWYRYKSDKFDREPEITRFLGNKSDYIDSTNYLLSISGLLKWKSIRDFYRKLIEARILNSHQKLNLDVKLEKNVKQISDFVNSYSVGSFIESHFWVAHSKSIIDEIRDSLSQIDLEDLLINPDRIVIHARRGDYYLDAKTRNFHGYCGLEHFIEGVAIIDEKDKWSSIIIYSDSPEFASELQSKLVSHYAKPVCVSLENNPVKILVDFQKANFFIGSNSTLSWWGNALGKHEVSIFPNAWFSNNNKHVYGKDYFLNEVKFTSTSLLTEGN